jgi:hypothetical protein
MKRTRRADKTLLLTLATFALLGFCALSFFWRDATAEDVAALTAHKQERESELRQLRADAEATKELAGRYSEDEVAAKLAPPDKPRLVIALEKQAASLFLHPFAAAFGPETIPLAREAVPEGLAESTLTLEGDAPDDLAARALIDAALQTLPGKATLREADLTRDKPAEALDAANVHFKIAIDLLANASERKK